MKSLLLLIIKLYWQIFPESRRRSCLFKETCSQFVFRNTIENGFFKGMIALRLRMRKCRKGYQLYSGLQGFEIELADGTVIKEDEIAPRILEPIYKKSYSNAGFSPEDFMKFGNPEK